MTVAAWQDVDAMWEADTAQLWEELNEADPIEDKLKEAAKDLSAAIDGLWSAENSLGEACAILSDTPMEDKINDFINALDDIRFDLQKMKKNFERGCRE